MKFYLHTINGRAAGFHGEQICFAQNGCGWKAPLVKDLNTIRKQQKQTRKWRKEMGYDFEPMDYDYVIVLEDER